MGSTLILHSNIVYGSTAYSRECCKKQQTLALNSCQFLSSKSILKLKRQSFLSIKQLRGKRAHPIPSVFAAQSNNFLRVIQTAWKVGKDGIDAGTNLVPDSVPRPVARISVAVVALTLALFVLKSFLSTAFFVLTTMGLIYFIFIALNKDEGPRGGGGGGGGGTNSPTSTEDGLEEARRIMEKYK